MEEKLLDKSRDTNVPSRLRKERSMVVVFEQILRGLIHMVQFSVSYCIMLLFMYSNGKYSSLYVHVGWVELVEN